MNTTTTANAAPPATDKRWRTAIASYTKDTVQVRGEPVGRLMRELDFGAALFLMCRSRRPSPAEARLVNAVLVHGGAGEQVARRMQAEVAAATQAGRSMEDHAREFVARARERKEIIEGYGHPLHPTGDERVDALRAIAEEVGLVGPHLRFATAVADEIERQAKRRIPLNIDGVMAAVLLDLGFDWRLVRMFVFVPRAAGISVHAVEETVRERGWRVIAPPDEIDYDGPAAA